MITLFQNILFLTEFLACNSCYGLFTKIKKGSGTSFSCKFFAQFFHKNVPNLILFQWTKFQCYTFFLSQDIKQNVLLSSYIGISWVHKLIVDTSFKEFTQVNFGKFFVTCCFSPFVCDKLMQDYLVMMTKEA